MRQAIENALSTSIRPYLKSLGNDISLTKRDGQNATFRIHNEPESIMRISLRAAVSMKLQELAPGLNVQFQD